MIRDALQAAHRRLARSNSPRRGSGEALSLAIGVAFFAVAIVLVLLSL